MSSDRLQEETLLVLYFGETLPNTKELCSTLFGSRWRFNNIIGCNVSLFY